MGMGLGREREQPAARRPLADVIAAEAAALLAIDGVSGVAEGLVEGEPAVLVLAGGLTQDDRQRIPLRLAGYAVVVRDTGTFHAPPPG